MTRDKLATATTIAGKVKPLKDEMNGHKNKLVELEMVRDAKIPDHEKLPKSCTFYKHFLQVAMNQTIEKAATD